MSRSLPFGVVSCAPPACPCGRAASDVHRGACGRRLPACQRVRLAEAVTIGPARRRPSDRRIPSPPRSAVPKPRLARSRPPWPAPVAARTRGGRPCTRAIPAAPRPRAVRTRPVRLDTRPRRAASRASVSSLYCPDAYSSKSSTAAAMPSGSGSRIGLGPELRRNPNAGWPPGSRCVRNFAAMPPAIERARSRLSIWALTACSPKSPSRSGSELSRRRSAKYRTQPRAWNASLKAKASAGSRMNRLK
jgi:hypothetical protein